MFLKAISIIIVAIMFPILFWLSAWQSYRESDYYRRQIEIHSQEKR